MIWSPYQCHTTQSEPWLEFMVDMDTAAGRSLRTGAVYPIAGINVHFLSRWQPFLQ